MIFFSLSKLLCFHLKFHLIPEETSISLADLSSQKKKMEANNRTGQKGYCREVSRQTIHRLAWGRRYVSGAGTRVSQTFLS